MSSRIRFPIALALAVALGAWLTWTSIGGSLQKFASPSEVSGAGTYRLAGVVAKGAPTNAADRAASASGLRFVVVDPKHKSKRLSVLYRGTVPDTFRVGRQVLVTGKLQQGTFVAQRDSLVTQCPSKFQARDRTGPADTAT